MRSGIGWSAVRIALIAAAGASAVGSQPAVSWKTSAEAYRGLIGSTLSVYCPPTAVPHVGNVSGTTHYTENSSICMAAIHALSAFDHLRGGTVYFTMERGLPAYSGQLARGVETLGDGPRDAGFRIVGAYVGLMPAEITATSPMEITWLTSAQHWRGLDSAHRVVQCPSARQAGLVWGKEHYADSSAICAAAVHAGLIKLAVGGGVMLRLEPAREKFAGGFAFGIRSDSTGRVEGSFVFTKAQPRVPRLMQGEDMPSNPTSANRSGLIVDLATAAGASADREFQIRQALAETRRREREEQDEARVAAAIAEQGLNSVAADDSSSAVDISWKTTAELLRGKTGIRKLNCTGTYESFPVWGTGIYLDQSSMCGAAVHAGVISKSGGQIIVKIEAGQKTYAGEVRNDVVSLKFGVGAGSFSVRAPSSR